MKTGQKGLFGYLFQVNILPVVLVNINFGGYNALIYVSCYLQWSIKLILFLGKCWLLPFQYIGHS